MQTIKIAVFDIKVLDELSTLPHIVSVNNIYYDNVIDKVFEVIVVYNQNFNDTKLLMYSEDLTDGAILMENTFWEELSKAKSKGEVVLLEGNEGYSEYLISSQVKLLGVDLKRDQ